ncbi:MAG: hypothetical protein H0W65_02555 [Sphingomonas sp.]|uniref:hypothetical protein n=1 Tax=Sphingomonas sp. TaxID=28214 RepID=UPI00182701CF|nr:hypothetical protein [Sphingomonas sp.]MBA3666591.1 hypothetical protein [Sphingomonas sp.]
MALASAAAWVRWPDHGGNFFAETLGIIVTVALIDRLIKWDEEARLEPARLAAFRDALALSRAATELIVGLARSSIPSSELPRVEQAAKNNGRLERWLADCFATIRASSPAPYGAPPPWGTGTQIWGVMLPKFVAQVRDLISRYMERHTTHGDPELTEVISDLEENGLFRSLSYGTDMFFLGQDDLRASMFDSYLNKVERLLDVASKLSPNYPQIKGIDGQTKFNWDLIQIEMTSHPKMHANEAPWRPA